MNKLIFLLFLHLQIPSPPQEGITVLIGADIYTAEGEIIKQGVIVFERGKIIEVGKDVSIPEKAEIIELKGKRIYPALIAGYSILGLIEISLVEETRDFREQGEFNSFIKAEEAINPESELIPVTRSNGVLISHTVPQGGIITGTSVLFYLDGWDIDEMKIKSPCAMFLKWPSTGMSSYMFYAPSMPPHLIKKRYREKLRKIEDFFKKAYFYFKNRKSMYVIDKRFEGMIPVFKKEIPLIVYAQKEREIKDAINFLSNYDIELVLAGGYDALKVKELLKEKNIPVIITGLFRTPMRDYEGFDRVFSLPYKLWKEGIKFCIAGSGSPFSAVNERNLPYYASYAMRYGLPEEEALKSITLYVAEILGVSDRIGSISEGKDASFVVTDGDIFDIRTNVLMAFIKGRKIDLSNKQKKLYEKYKNKYIRNPNP